jgi:hypothetical protein
VDKNREDTFVLDSKDFNQYYIYKSCSTAVFSAMGYRPLYFLQPNVISVVHVVSGSLRWIAILMLASSSFSIDLLISLCPIMYALYEESG